MKDYGWVRYKFNTEVPQMWKMTTFVGKATTIRELRKKIIEQENSRHWKTVKIFDETKKRELKDTEVIKRFHTVYILPVFQ